MLPALPEMNMPCIFVQAYELLTTTLTLPINLDRKIENKVTEPVLSLESWTLTKQAVRSSQSVSPGELMTPLWITPTSWQRILHGYCWKV